MQTHRILPDSPRAWLSLLIVALVFGSLSMTTPAAAAAGAQGRYRVVVNGFFVQQETWDHALQTDGKRDEVFLSTKSVVMTRSGQLVVESEGTSRTMGDINNQPGRVQAGTASDKGGLRTNDAFPTATPWIRATPPSIERNYPPLSIWEGTLTQGEHSVVITPTIFEWDNGGDGYSQWSEWARNLFTKVRGKAEQLTGPGSKVIYEAVDLGLDVAVSLDSNTLLGENGTRPIGMHKSPADGNKFEFKPRAIVLNYDTAEYIVQNAPAGKGNGVVELAYTDAGEIGGGRYVLYVQVERVYNRAQFVSQTVPGTMEPGKTYTVAVRMRNAGTSTWTFDPLKPYRLGAQNPQDNSIWGRNRVDLPWDSAAGQSTIVEQGKEVTFSFPVTAPTTPGTYNFQWRMVQEFVEWFGDITPNVAVSVATASSPLPPAPSNLDEVQSVRGEEIDQDLVWRDNSANEDRFELKYQQAGTSSWYTKTLAANTTRFRLDTSFMPYNTYNFYVQACNAYGCSAASNIISVLIE